MLPWVQSFCPVLSIVAIIVGWMYVSWDNNRRESRKELRGLLNDIRSLVIAIEGMAHDYYQRRPEDTFKLGGEIRRELQHLAGLLTALKLRDSKFRFDTQLASYRKSVTLNDFDAPSRQPRGGNDPILLEISVSALDLRDATEALFCRSYK